VDLAADLGPFVGSNDGKSGGPFRLLMDVSDVQFRQVGPRCRVDLPAPADEVINLYRRLDADGKARVREYWAKEENKEN